MGGHGGAGDSASGSGGGPSDTLCGDGSQLEGDGCGPHGDCIDNSDGRACSCEVGYHAEANGCVDDDECSQQNGGCERDCKNIDGGYRCECPAGYLRKDGKSCWEWSSARQIESEDLGDAFEPRVGMDPKSNITVVWRQSNGTRFDIWSNRYAERKWGKPQKIEADDAADADRPALTVDETGHALALWCVGPETEWNRFDSTWGSAASLWRDQLSGISPTNVVGNSDGIVMFARNSFHQGAWYYTQRFSGTAWSDDWAQIPNGPAMSNPTMADLDLALDDFGDALAVWTQSDSISPRRVYADRFVSDTGWESDPTQLNDDAAMAVSSPKVGVNSYGRNIVIWTEGEGASAKLWSRQYHRATGWTDRVKVSDIADSDASLRVRVDGSDNALAIWKQVDPSRGGIWSARFDDETSSWQTPENIEPSASGNAEAPQIAMNNDGIAIAVWMLHDGERAHVWANRYAPDTGWGNARQLDDAKSGDASAPDVAIDVKGNAAVVWQQSDGTRSNIVASHFD